MIPIFADIVNFFILVSLIIYFLNIKIINVRIATYLLSSILGCYLFNLVLFDPFIFPDQNKYFGISQYVRRNLIDILFFGIPRSEYPSYAFIFSGIYLAIIPMFIETISSLGFSNKLLYIITLVFLYKKRALKEKHLILFIFFPSIYLYSSLSLRDNIIFCFLLLTVYFFFERKFLFTLICLAIVVSSKYITGLVVLYFLVIYFIIFYKKSFIKERFLFVLILNIIFIHFVFDEFLISKLNHHSSAFFLENNFIGQNKAINNMFEFYSLIPTKFFWGMIGFSYQFDIFKQSLFVENLFVIFLLIYIFFKFKNLNKYRIIFWYTFILSSEFLLTYLVYNQGTLSRYEYPLIFTFIFAIIIENQKKNFFFKKL